MSWDITIEPPVQHLADQGCSVCKQHPGHRTSGRDQICVETAIEVGNMTWNVSPVYYEAMGWSLSSLNGVLAAIPIRALEAGLLEIQSRPEYYSNFVRGRGDWGNIAYAIDYLHRLLHACRAMPTGMISVS